MSCRMLTLLGISIYLAAAPAWGDLPSLMSDKSMRPPVNGPTARLASASAEVPPARLLGVESPLKGRLSLFAPGDLDYRFNRSGIKTRWQSGAVSFDTAIGYGGKRQLELNWRTGGGKLKFVAGADEGTHGYRVEFTRNF